MQLTHERMLRWGILTGAFAIPTLALLVIPQMYFPADAPKGFGLRIIVGRITGAWLILILFNRKYRPSRSWIIYALACIVLVTAIAVAHSVDPYRSFWGNFERMGGFITSIALFLYILITSSVIRSERLWRILFQYSLVISVIVGIYGFLEIAGVTPLTLGSRSLLESPMIGPFGNPLYLSAYMLIHIFIAALLWATMKKTAASGPTDQLVPWFCGSVIAFDATVMFFTSVRGSVLGLLVGAFASLFIFAVLKKSRTMLGTVCIALVCMIGVGTYLTTVQNTTFVQNVRPIAYIAQTSLHNETVRARLLNYGIAWRAIKEKPILGWGEENYVAAFSKHYDARLEARGWADRVHNALLQVLVDKGALGLFSYLALTVAIAWTLLRTKRFSIAEQAVLSGLFIGIFVQDLFEFNMIMSSVLLGTIIAYIISRVDIRSVHKEIVSEATKPIWLVASVTVMIAFASIYIIWRLNADALVANIAFRRATQLEYTAPLQSLRNYELALSRETFGSLEIREQIAKYAASLPFSNIDDVTARQFFTFAKDQMQKELTKSPPNARGGFYLGVLCHKFADFACADTALRTAHNLAPSKQSILIALSANSFATNDLSSAISYAKQAFDLYPDFKEVRIIYTRLIILSGNDILADELLKPLMNDNAAADIRIVEAYIARQRPDKIVPIAEYYRQTHPDDEWGYLVMATSQYWAGNDAEATEGLQALAENVPSPTINIGRLIQDIQDDSQPRDVVAYEMLKLVQSTFPN